MLSPRISVLFSSSLEAPMGRYIIRRLLQALLLLFLLSIGMFALIHLLPGGPDQVIFNPRLSAAGRAALRTRFGLDEPIPIPYLKLLGKAFTRTLCFSCSGYPTRADS